jgi:hypothetical protein
MIRQQKIAVTVLTVSLLGLFFGIAIILTRRFVPGFPKTAVAFGSAILAFGVKCSFSQLRRGLSACNSGFLCAPWHSSRGKNTN